MNVRPLFDRLLVERNDAPDKTKSGLYIPSSATDKPHQGKVLAVGNGHVNEDGSSRPLQVKAGDTIVFGKYAGNEIKLNGEEHIILRESEILAVLDQ